MNEREEEIKVKLKELAKKLKSIYNNAEIQDGFNLYDAKTRRKADKVAWQIYWLQKELKEIRMVKADG